MQPQKPGKWKEIVEVKAKKEPNWRDSPALAVLADGTVWYSVPTWSLMMHFQGAPRPLLTSKGVAPHGCTYRNTHNTHTEKIK